MFSACICELHLSHNRDQSDNNDTGTAEQICSSLFTCRWSSAAVSLGRQCEAVTEAGSSQRHWNVGKKWGDKDRSKFPLASVQVEEAGISFWPWRGD